MTPWVVQMVDVSSKNKPVQVALTALLSFAIFSKRIVTQKSCQSNRPQPRRSQPLFNLQHHLTKPMNVAGICLLFICGLGIVLGLSICLCYRCSEWKANRKDISRPISRKTKREADCELAWSESPTTTTGHDSRSSLESFGVKEDLVQATAKDSPSKNGSSVGTLKSSLESSRSVDLGNSNSDPKEGGDSAFEGFHGHQQAKNNGMSRSVWLINNCH